MRFNIFPKPILIKGNSIIIVLLLLVGGCKNKDGKFSSIESEIGDISMGTAEEIKDLLSQSEANLFRSDSVSQFYASRNFKPVWKEISLRQSFIDSLKAAESQGLYFDDYHGQEIKKFNAEIKDLSVKQQSEFDVLLTDAFLKFGDHLYNGKTDPKKLHEIWDVDKPKINLQKLLKNVVDENDLEAAFKILRPQNPVYKQLIAAEKEFRNSKKSLKASNKFLQEN